MEKSNRQKGSQAEQIAQEYLRRKGYRIVDSNWQYGHLELDIIAEDGDELVIVEVKSRYGSGFTHPIEAISEKKMQQVIQAADAWIMQADWDKDARFDLITVVFTGPDEFELEHYEEAFNPQL